MPYAADRFVQQPSAGDATNRGLPHLAGARPFPQGELSAARAIVAGPDAGSSFWGSAEPEQDRPEYVESVVSYPAVLPNSPVSHQGEYLVPTAADPSAEQSLPGPQRLDATEFPSAVAELPSPGTPAEPVNAPGEDDDFFAQGPPAAEQLGLSEPCYGGPDSDYFGSAPGSAWSDASHSSVESGYFSSEPPGSPEIEFFGASATHIGPIDTACPAEPLSAFGDDPLGLGQGMESAPTVDLRHWSSEEPAAGPSGGPLTGDLAGDQPAPWLPESAVQPAAPLAPLTGP
ncbi:MAG: hypothetical protein ACRC0L_07025, partial [Angustibacter sp.]